MKLPKPFWNTPPAAALGPRGLQAHSKALWLHCIGAPVLTEAQATTTILSVRECSTVCKMLSHLLLSWFPSGPTPVAVGGVAPSHLADDESEMQRSRAIYRKVASQGLAASLSLL